MKNILLRDGAVMTPDGWQDTDILWEDGNISIAANPERNIDMLRVTGKLLYPGFIDIHVHTREPGGEHKATMATESLSALKGGVTTMGNMPNTSPATVTVAELRNKVRIAAEVATDMRFFFGITEQADLDEFIRLMESQDEETVELRKRCCGVKLYLDHSTGDQKVDAGILKKVFAACKYYDVQLVAHCEDPQTNALAKEMLRGRADVAAHSEMRPPESEEKAIMDAIALVRETGARLHVAHLSTRQGIDLVRAAKKEGLPVTCEVAPHYLFCTTDDYETLGARIKMNPPIRPEEHRDALWAGVMDGTVDCIATDHAPHTIQEKANPEPLKAPSGVPGVATMIPLLLTVAAGKWPHPTSKRPENLEFTYDDIHRLCFENPNRIFRLGKNDIKIGQKADVVVVDPDAEWIIKAEELRSKCGWTPYEGWKVRGKILRVLMAA